MTRPTNDTTNDEHKNNDKALQVGSLSPSEALRRYLKSLTDEQIARLACKGKD